MTQQRSNESDEDYKKRKRRVQLSMMGGLANGGGSLILAAIIYNMDTFNLDVDVRTIDNAGAESSSADAPMYASNHIFLDGSTQSVDYPIPYTLGSDKDVQAFSATVGDDTGSASVLGQIATFNLVGDGTSTAGAVGEWRDSPIVIVEAGTTYKIVLNVVINSGAFVPTQFRYGELTVNVNDIGLIQGNQYTSSFIHTFEFTTGNQAALSQPIFYNSNQIAGSYTLEVQSIEQITNPNSFLTYLDTATKSHVTVDNSITLSTTYTQEDSHSNTFTTTVALTDLDRSLLNLKPESIARLVDGETVSELSFDLTEIEAFYPGNEGEASGEFVQDVMVDLGSELYTGAVDAGDITITAITDGFNFVGNAPAAAAGWIDFVTTSIEDVIELSFDAVVNSGEYTIDATGYPHIDNGSVPHTIITGRNILILSGVINTVNPLNVTIADQTSPTFDIDIINMSIKQIVVAEITNYASTCRTNLDLTNYGASNLLYKQDATGRWLSMADAGTIVGASDGRNIDIQMTTPYNHLVTKDIDKIEGTLDSCTITYVDTTTEIVP